MRLICNRPQLSGEYGTVTLGQYFECPDEVGASLLAAGHGRRIEQPKVIYEKKPRSFETPEVSPRRPFVTCVCLTRNRRQWLPQAIECFRAQTYAPRELLILSDGDDVRALVPDDDSIRHIHLADNLPVGEKRNFGCLRAAGSLVAHWDDDDHSEPGRLADQVARLEASGKSVAGYHSIRFTDGRAWWQYTGNESFAVGTSLCYRLTWWRAQPFEPVQVGQDETFSMRAHECGELISYSGNDFMHATIHPGNTSPRSLTGSRWKAL
jgi:hypothetical protein